MPLNFKTFGRQNYIKYTINVSNSTINIHNYRRSMPSNPSAASVRIQIDYLFT